MIFSQKEWQKHPLTQSQRIYITKMMNDHPELPPFVGTTKGDAAIYIEKYKKKLQKTSKKGEQNGYQKD